MGALGRHRRKLSRLRAALAPMDQGFGFDMQKSARDTMTDLIVDAAGAFLAAWMGYHYVKDGDSLIADQLVRRFVARNPRLFPPRQQ